MTLTIHCRGFDSEGLHGGSIELTVRGVNIPDILNAIDDEAAIATWLAERREVEAEDERVVKGLKEKADA